MSIRDFVVNVKHSSKVLTFMWYVFRQPVFVLKNIKYEQDAKARKKGRVDNEYIGMKDFKNIHKGERCFIVATGPSLRIEDLEMLANEYTFGMNSICRLYDKTEWRPTYYAIQDCNVYEKLEDDILAAYSGKKNVFIGSPVAKRFGVPEGFQQFPLNAAYHDNQLELDRYFAKFSDDCYSMVYDGYSITYSIIQIAMYMGFKEIYLLGADCSYKKGEKNHIEESGFVDKNEEKNHDKMVVGYKKAKEFAEKNGVIIINCTRKGMLEVYKREKLETILQRKRNENENDRYCADEIE